MAVEDGPSFLMSQELWSRRTQLCQRCRRLKFVVVVVGQHRTGAAPKQCSVALQAFLKWNSRQKNKQRRQICCHVAPLLFDISYASDGPAPPSLVRLCQHHGSKAVVSN